MRPPMLAWLYARLTPKALATSAGEREADVASCHARDAALPSAELKGEVEGQGEGTGGSSAIEVQRRWLNEAM